jgi:methyltransferase (TIGR00027 family)
MVATLLADRADELIGFHQAHGGHPVLSSARGQVVCRSRYTEDRLAERIRNGLAQYVILGAGLDSFAYRSPLAGQVRVFEVDQPATQEWKQAALAAAQISIPDNVTFVPVDAEADTLADRLIHSGFDPSRPALVSWLGVTMYLAQDAIGHTLATIGNLAPGTELIADYMLPAGLRDAAGDNYVDLVGPVAAELGEPWVTFLSPDDMSALLNKHNFGPVRHIRQHDAVDPALWNRSDALRPIDLTVLAHATVT